MSENFVIWRYQPQPFAAILGKITGLERLFRLNNFTPLAEGFPDDVRLHFHPDFPTDLQLLDNMRNTDNIAVVSARLKQAIQDRTTSGVEYLPVSLVDHKGRTASDQYFIIHPVDPIDGVDRDESVFEESRLHPGRFEFFDKLVLDEQRIPPDRQLFGLEGFGDIMLVRRELATALDEQGFTGLGWQSIDEYPEI
jgi:hypothetical protein